MGFERNFLKIDIWIIKQHNNDDTLDEFAGMNLGRSLPGTVTLLLTFFDVLFGSR
jgi:hypothetical protein